MTVKLSKLLSVFESLWPQSGADEWDQVGLACGSANQEIDSVLFCVDPTLSVLQEAKKKSCQLVVSHHPLLIDGVHSVAEGELKGDILSYAITNSIAIFSAHTNADTVPGGVSDVLASKIGIKNSVPLVSTAKDSGHGRIGLLDKAETVSNLAKRISDILPPTQAPIRVAGDPTKLVTKIAIVGGSGASFLPDAISAGADCFITSDLKHHVSLDAVSQKDNQICLIDISHFAAESLWLTPASAELALLVPEVKFLVSEVITDPWSLTIPGKLA